jgi:hypothetical protein
MATFSPNTVDVQVFRSTRVVAANALEFPMYLIPHNLSTNTVDSFSDSKGATDLGAATNSPFSKFISGTFNGIAPPDLAKIGRMPITATEIKVTAVPAVGEDITVYAKVAGVEKLVSYTIVTEVTNAINEAAAGLEAALTTAFGGANDPVFSSATDTITATIIGSTLASSFGYASADLSTKFSVPHTRIKNISSATPVATLTSILNEDGNFYFVGAESRDEVEVDALAVFVQSNDMQYVSATSDVGVKDSGDTGNISLTLQAKNLDQTVMTFSTQADWEFPEAGVVGAWAGIRPYNVNSLNLRTIRGLIADNLTNAERQTLAERNTNFYFIENGTSNFYEGWAMAEGTEFADTVRFALWSKLATKSAIFNRLKQRSDAGSAVPYHDLGAAELRAVIQRDMVDVGVRGGTIATGWTEDNTGQSPVRINLDPVIDMSSRAAQTNANIGNRIWDGVEVEMVYISPIHHVNVNLHVILNRDPS